jgi:hypothetical protein
MSPADPLAGYLLFVPLLAPPAFCSYALVNLFAQLMMPQFRPGLALHAFGIAAACTTAPLLARLLVEDATELQHAPGRAFLFGMLCALLVLVAIQETMLKRGLPATPKRGSAAAAQPLID